MNGMSPHLLHWTFVGELQEMLCELGVKHALYAQHFGGPGEELFSFVGKTVSYGQPGVWEGILESVLAPMDNQPVATVAAMWLNYVKLKESIMRETERLKNREKQRILPTIKWQEGGPSKSLVNNYGKI